MATSSGSGNLPQPPKFQGPTAPAPQNTFDWVTFFRWLVNLWQVASDSIGAQESITIALQSNAGNNESETLGAAQAFVQSHPVSGGILSDATLGGAQAIAQSHPAIAARQPDVLPQYLPPGQKPADELTDLVALALARPPYPQRPGGGYVLVGLRATRLGLDATAYAQYEFYESDSTLIYISDGSHWLWVGGVYARMQSQLATLASGLTTHDTGLRVNVTDYAHMLMWSGSAWQWAPEDDQRAGEGPIMREVDPNPTTGWNLYDGSTVNYLKFDGSTASVTLPNLVGTAAYAKLGSPNSGPHAPTAPGATASGTGSIASATTGVTPPAATGSNTTGITNPADTGTASTGITNPADTGTATTGVSNPANTGSASTGITITGSDNSFVSPAFTAGPNNVSNHPHQHPITDPGHLHTIGAPTDPGHLHTIGAPTDPGHQHSIGAPTDPGHTHTIGALTDPGHTHTLTLSSLTITVDTTGEPENLVRRPWFRQ